VLPRAVPPLLGRLLPPSLVPCAVCERQPKSGSLLCPCARRPVADPPQWLLSASAGLVAVAVALVAEAALLLSNKLCKEPATQLVCCASAALAYAFPNQWLFPVLILGGEVLGPQP